METIEEIEASPAICDALDELAQGESLVCHCDILEWTRAKMNSLDFDEERLWPHHYIPAVIVKSIDLEEVFYLTQRTLPKKEEQLSCRWLSEYARSTSVLDVVLTKTNVHTFGCFRRDYDGSWKRMAPHYLTSF